MHAFLSRALLDLKSNNSSPAEIARAASFLQPLTSHSVKYSNFFALQLCPAGHLTALLASADTQVQSAGLDLLAGIATGQHENPRRDVQPYLLRFVLLCTEKERNCFFPATIVPLTISRSWYFPPSSKYASQLVALSVLLQRSMYICVFFCAFHLVCVSCPANLKDLFPLLLLLQS